MRRRLGRSISDASWAVATERSFVSDALDSKYATGEDDLLSFLGDLLRVLEAASRRPARRKASKLVLIPMAAEARARIEAISRLAADHAAGDEDILRFRQRVLGRDTPMSAPEAEAYLDLPDARYGRGTSPDGGRLEVLSYQNRRVSHDLHVRPGSPLDQLRTLAERLAEAYPWQPAQAASFVLEGLTPLATPFTLHLPQMWQEDRPRRAKLIMEVDLWMPASAVLEAYRRIQRKVLPGHNRPISARSVELVNFVMQHRPSTWPSLVERWNTEHPRGEYANYRSFRFAFERASRSLLHPRYRRWLGQ